MVHEDFVQTYFVEDNEQAICAALGQENLADALDWFEDTRSAEQVNEMLAKLEAVTHKKFVWDDELEVYIKN